VHIPLLIQSRKRSPTSTRDFAFAIYAIHVVYAISRIDSWSTLFYMAFACCVPRQKPCRKRVYLQKFRTQNGNEAVYQ